MEQGGRPELQRGEEGGVRCEGAGEEVGPEGKGGAGEGAFEVDEGALFCVVGFGRGWGGAVSGG